MKLTHISPHEVKVIAHLVQVLTPCYPELDAMTRAAIQRELSATTVPGRAPGVQLGRDAALPGTVRLSQ
jgi:hypothetical protein